MNTVSISLKIFQQKRKEFLQTVHTLQSDLRKDPGLIKSRLFQDKNDSERFQLINEWETYQDYDRYLRSEAFRVLIGALKVLSEETDVRYHIGPRKNGQRVPDV